MINNLELIKPLLNFSEQGDFYMLYVFKRKKDQPEGERDNQFVQLKRIVLSLLNIWNVGMMKLNSYVKCLRHEHTFTYKNKIIKTYR